MIDLTFICLAIPMSALEDRLNFIKKIIHITALKLFKIINVWLMLLFLLLIIKSYYVNQQMLIMLSKLKRKEVE